MLNFAVNKTPFLHIPILFTALNFLNNFKLQFAHTIVILPTTGLLEGWHTPYTPPSRRPWKYGDEAIGTNVQ